MALLQNVRFTEPTGLRGNATHALGRRISVFSRRELTSLAKWTIFLCTRLPQRSRLRSQRHNLVFSLSTWWTTATAFNCLDNPRSNFTPAFLKKVAETLSVLPNGAHGLPAGLTPEDIFHYAYAVFHSSDYRSRYAEFLKIDFPRLPLTGNLELFRALARLGSELTALHLLESPKLDKPVTEFIGGRNPKVEKVSWSRNTVWVDKEQTTGFRCVREAVWNFHIGGYQVCEKWLKDRKRRHPLDGRYRALPEDRRRLERNHPPDEGDRSRLSKNTAGGRALFQGTKVRAEAP